MLVSSFILFLVWSDWQHFFWQLFSYWLELPPWIYGVLTSGKPLFPLGPPSIMIHLVWLAALFLAAILLLTWIAPLNLWSFDFWKTTFPTWTTQYYDTFFLLGHWGFSGLSTSYPPSTTTNLTLAQLAGAVECTNCFSAEEGGKTPPTSVLDMTLNNLMVRFQQCWSFGEYGVPLHCHHSQVHSDPEW